MKISIVVCLCIAISLCACGKGTRKEKQDLLAPVSFSCPDSSNIIINDNMRGFDPASEDDTDDNGMGRYMENNDEEGWD